jgi:hypothetical protein
MFVELLLNFCWLALVLPAFLLWRQRASSDRSARRSILFLCTLGCVLVLLFPVISASDDLHSGGLAIEESRRTLGHGGHFARSLHSVAHVSQSAVPATGISRVVFALTGAVFTSSPHSLETLLTACCAGRAPPV